VDDRSPLIGHKEEPEWILERLTSILDRELEEMKREELEGRGDWEMDGRWRRRSNHDRNEGPYPEIRRPTMEGKAKVEE
jgi:hypothetical protein